MPNNYLLVLGDYDQPGKNKIKKTRLSNIFYYFSFQSKIIVGSSHGFKVFHYPLRNGVSEFFTLKKEYI